VPQRRGIVPWGEPPRACNLRCAVGDCGNDDAGSRRAVAAPVDGASVAVV